MLLATYTPADATSSYQSKSLNMTPFLGKTVTVKATGQEDASAGTLWFLDNFNLVTG